MLGTAPYLTLEKEGGCSEGFRGANAEVHSSRRLSPRTRARLWVDTVP